MTSLGADTLGHAMAAREASLEPIQAELTTPAPNVELTGEIAERVASNHAVQAGVAYIAPGYLTVKPDLFEYLPVTQAQQWRVAPFADLNGCLHLAIVDPWDLDLIDRLERITGRQVEISVASAETINAALRHGQVASETLRDVSEDFKLVLVKEDDSGNEHAVALFFESDADESAPVVKLVNTLLVAALQKRASDVHLEVFAHGIAVKYRIDGVLYPATDVLDKRYHGALLTRLKVMAELDISEKRTPQDGRFKIRYGERDIDFRVSIIPTAFGEDVVIRILDKSSITGDVTDLRLDSLGVEGDLLKRLRRIIHAPYGMILITGPTGSGKTTTLYAALNELNSVEEKIITIEDPVEYLLDGIIQIPVNEKKGLTFARGLRAILRHDPDKIMVGEIRDSETANIAVQAALTGHLVFSTVHANNAIDVIWRFVHMGVDLYDFVSSVSAVMAQRLVRVICPHCKGPANVDNDTLILGGLEEAEWRSATWYVGRGCVHCNETGYRGRTVVAELLSLTPQIRQLLIDKRSYEEIEAAARQQGMQTLREAAIARALRGETTLKEVYRVTRAI